MNLARLERQTGRAEHAAQLLEAASRRPALASRPALWVQLSLTERVAGNLDDAEQAARRALSLRRDPGAYEALALVSSARGQDREAELLATSALRLDEARASTHVTLGLVAYRLGEVGRARAEFDRAAALDPSSADAWANLGALALGWRDYAGAERAYRRASELEPWSIDSRLHLAEALAAEACRGSGEGGRGGVRRTARCSPVRPTAPRPSAAPAGRSRSTGPRRPTLRGCCAGAGTSPGRRLRSAGESTGGWRRSSRWPARPASPPAGPEAASSRSGGGGVREQASGTGGGR